jgi:hypothetical protein
MHNTVLDFNHKSHTTSLPHTGSASILNPIISQTPQISHSLHHCIRTSITNFISQLFHLIRQSILTHLAHSSTQSCHNHNVSLYYHTKQNLQPTHVQITVPLTPSVCIHNPIINITSQLSHSLSQSELAPQPQTAHQNRSTHFDRQNSPAQLQPHPTFFPLILSVYTHIPITNIKPLLSHSLR